MYSFDHKQLIQRLSNEEIYEIINDWDQLVTYRNVDRDSLLYKTVEAMQLEIAQQDRFLAMQTNPMKLATEIANCCMLQWITSPCVSS